MEASAAAEPWPAPVPSRPAPASRPPTLVAPRVLALVLAANAALALGGVARDLLLARYFGLTPSADALNLAWFLTDLCGNQVLAAVVAAAAVPFLAAPRPEAERDPARLGRLLAAVGVLSLAAAALLAAAAGPLVRLIEPGIPAAGAAAAVRGMRAMAPYAVAVPLGAVLAGELQVRRRFVVAAAAGLVASAGMLAAELRFGPGEHVAALLAGVAAGAVAALVWPLAVLARAGADLRPRLPDRAAAGRLWGLGGPIGGWLILTQLGQAVDRHFAAGLGAGALSAISFAAKFGQAPTWIFAAAVTMMIYPALAEDAADPAARRAKVARGLVLVVAGAVPFAAILGFGAHPLLQLLLAHGRLSAGDAARVAAALAAFAPGIPAAAAATLLYRALFASPRPARALAGAALTLAVGAAGDALLAPRLGLPGIGLAGAAAQWAGAVLCWGLVRAEAGAPRQRGGSGGRGGHPCGPPARR